MLYINKIVITRRGVEFAAPFYAYSLAFSENRDKIRLIIVDSETSKEFIVEDTDFVSLLNKMYDLNPYGYAITNENFGEYDRFVAVPKQAMKFLEYIDSVELLYQYECDNVDFSAFTRYQVCDTLDENTSLFTGNLLSGDGDFVTYAEADITLYDAVCLSQAYCDGKCYYIQTDIQGPSDYGRPNFYVYKVNCTNFNKVQAMIARSNVYRPNLFQDLYSHGRL